MPKSQRGKEDEQYRQRKIEDALWWLNQEYGGKKVVLNPVSIIKYDERHIAPHGEDILVEAMKRSNLKIDWGKYEHYKMIRDGKKELRKGK